MNQRSQYDGYYYNVINEGNSQYYYKIYTWNDYLGCEENIESAEYYDSLTEANNSAKERISDLMNGE